jgi:hypothetical protein
MARMLILLSVVGALALALPSAEQEVPGSVEEVARPGGDLPGDPQIALVKVADGFNPVNVANAGDGSGRIFVVTSTSAASASGSVRIPTAGRV